MASSSSEPTKPEEFGGGGGVGESSEAAASFPLDTDQLLLYRGLKKAKKERGCTAKERISKMPPCTAGKRSSVYRGVTRHRWTGRYEAHLWDKSTWNQTQNKKGKQVYLGAYDDEVAAARAYDLAALKYWGPGTLINFPVKDYTRDLEEMQNVSREDYLASLRRKSSGFSRGISKYRPLSSRWDSQFGRMPDAAYFNNTLYGSHDEASIESDYVGGFCIDRKIDLSNYIKWWGANKSSQTDAHAKSSDETKHGCPEDIGIELKALERSNKSTEPYEMPRLGLSTEGKKNKTASAMSILSQSAAYKSLQTNALKKKEKDENDENENKSSIKKIDLGKTVDKSWQDAGSERLGVASGIGGGLSMQRNAYPLAPLLSAPLLTSYNTIDPLTDPVLWSSLVSILPAGSSHTTGVGQQYVQVTKNESSSDYTFFQQGD